tara:strand:- start:310 stop:495 length:186 start_codon:yes stop_codon:yes gene_type:complete
MDIDDEEHENVDAQLMHIGKHLKSKLSTLPAPKNEYSIALPKNAREQLEAEEAASAAGMNS